MRAQHPASMTQVERDEFRATMLPVDAVKAMEGEKNAYAVYFYNHARSGKPVACGFRAKRLKYDFAYVFKDDEERQEWCQSWCRKLEALTAEKAARKAEQRAKPHGLQVGDILKSSWGYDQTNIDYYQVTQVVGVHTVVIREIAAHTEENGFMSGDCVPVLGAFIGGELRRRVSPAGGVKINSVSVAFKKEPTSVVDGVPLYGVDRWTAYA